MVSSLFIGVIRKRARKIMYIQIKNNKFEMDEKIGHK